MEYKLDEIFDLQMGKTPSRNNPEYWDSEDYKWISIADLSKCGKYIEETKEYLSDKAVDESGISLIPANTVIMSFKLSIGKTAITSEPMYSNEAIMSFRDKHVVELLPDYIYYMFSGKNWEEGTNKAVMGKTLNKATLSGVKIDIHDIAKQHEIVEVLDKLSSVIENRQRELEKLDELIKARFVEMFGDYHTNSKGFECHPGSELFKFSSGKFLPEERRLDEGIPVYGGNGIAWYTDEPLIEHPTVIIGRVGAWCGNIHTVLEPVWITDNAIYIKELKTDKFTLEFLTELMKVMDFHQYSDFSGQPKITQKPLETSNYLTPPVEMQIEFTDFVKQVNKSKVAVQKSLDETQKLFDSLMQEYFG